MREILASYCATALGRELALGMAMLPDPAAVEQELDRLEELQAVEEEPPLSGIDDVRGLLRQAQAGAVLTGPELVRLGRCCETLRAAGEFFRRHASRTPTLAAMVGLLGSWPEIEQEVGWALDESGAVRDAATPELQRIRQDLRRRRSSLLGLLEGMVAAEPGMFEGPVAVRSDRFVLPVRQEHKGRVPGVVHAVSGTGQTVFVEPLQTIAEQNEVQELRDAETQEQARVLRHLSSLVAASAAELGEALTAAARLDLLTAKCRFGRRCGATRPRISDGGLVMVAARHPLLLTRGIEVVPLDLEIGTEERVLLVSGPNAGGKTVVLKTVGLLALMLKAGMFLPAASGTRLPFFSEVFADIGDEQSLDANLSSFTAHLARLKEFVERADRCSLVLIDEIGASTAPEEGAALAIGVLQTLCANGALTVATTHFGALKAFVQDEPGMSNAGMEFRNGPTYRLVPGTAGESSAFDIAERAGLPREVLERARARMDRKWLDRGEKLRALNAELEQAREARREAGREREEAARLAQEYEARLSEFRRWQADERSKFVREQTRLLRETRREIENLVRRIRESGAQHESIVAAKTYVDGHLAAVEQSDQEPVESAPAEPLTPGDTVESQTFHRQGTVVAVEGGQVVVGFGNIRMVLRPADLRRVDTVASPPAVPLPDAEPRFEPRLDVRGLDRQDADQVVNRFLDDAQVAGAAEVSILHGRGTGALRRHIWERLRHDRRVESVRFAEPVDGGIGVTFVRMKQAMA